MNHKWSLVFFFATCVFSHWRYHSTFLGLPCSCGEVRCQTSAPLKVVFYFSPVLLKKIILCLLHILVYSDVSGYGFILNYSVWKILRSLKLRINFYFFFLLRKVISCKLFSISSVLIFFPSFPSSIVQLFSFCFLCLSLLCLVFPSWNPDTFDLHTFHFTNYVFCSA